MSVKIEKVRGRQVWDSRGRPTVEADIVLEGGSLGRAIAPAGASRGSAEAVDLRDGGERFGGFGVSRAVQAVNTEIASALAGKRFSGQAMLDQELIALDGTPTKSRLGGNATTAVSMAFAHAQAAHAGMPLWKWLAGERPVRLPLPEIQLFGGGAHAAERVDVQDFMVIAVGATTFAQALDWTAEVYRAAGSLLKVQGLLAGVADEGGWWPMFESNEAGLEWTVRAIEQAGFRPGTDLAISLDIAASEFGNNGSYRLNRDDRVLDRDEMTDLLCGWLRNYPIVSIEDPLAEDDLEGWQGLLERLPESVQVIGDDLLVTNAEHVRRAQKNSSCNALLVKPNQAGTLTEAFEALQAAHAAGWNTVVSARSGETEDVTIVHLAVGWGAAQLKVGSFARSERMAKWNEGLRLAEAIGSDALPPRSEFPWE
ncbi:MAG TPA: phosphopyruvate hydratase [Deltaproteobacteria bacterium]|nr:phosphopyruvate hydratase [Deltaproteobacteria bacterium]